MTLVPLDIDEQLSPIVAHLKAKALDKRSEGEVCFQFRISPERAAHAGRIGLLLGEALSGEMAHCTCWGSEGHSAIIEVRFFE